MHGLHTITISAAAAVARTQAWADATLKHRPIGLPHSTDVRAIVSHIHNLATVTAALVQAATSSGVMMDGLPPTNAPTDRIEPPAEPLPLATMMLYHDLAHAVEHALAGSVSTNAAGVQVVQMPYYLFELLVRLANKVEAADPSARVTPAEDLLARHCSGVAPVGGASHV